VEGDSNSANVAPRRWCTPSCPRSAETSDSQLPVFEPDRHRGAGHQKGRCRMDIDARPVGQTRTVTRRRRLLGVTAASAAALALTGRSAATARANEDRALVGSWMVVGIPSGAPPGPPRILVSFTGDAWPCALRRCNK